jgi:ribosomal protein S18 acetylase RimI-like enzyme
VKPAQANIIIRQATPEDYESIWFIIRSVIKAGDTYVFNPNASRERMLEYWCGPDTYTYVALIGETIKGTFVLRDNKPDLGSHIGNGSYMVDPSAHGLGIGRRMGEYSIVEATRLGYRAIQFNYVVKSNQAAVNLWLSLGFQIVGEVPDAFNHSRLGYTNVYVMYRRL